VRPGARARLTRVRTGVYIDRRGGLHVDMPELLSSTVIADTAFARRWFGRRMLQELRALVERVLIVAHLDGIPEGRS
jgi:hypothetical protein